MLAHGARVGRLVGELIIGVQVIGDHVRAGVHQRGEHGRGVDAAAEQHTDPPAAGVEAHGIEQQLIGNLGVLGEQVRRGSAIGVMRSYSTAVVRCCSRMTTWPGRTRSMER